MIYLIFKRKIFQIRLRFPLFNTTLLHDEKYVNQIKNIISDAEIDYQNLKDKGLTWEITKMKIRSYSIPNELKRKEIKDIY